MTPEEFLKETATTIDLDELKAAVILIREAGGLGHYECTGNVEDLKKAATMLQEIISVNKAIVNAILTHLEDPIIKKKIIEIITDAVRGNTELIEALRRCS